LKRKVHGTKSVPWLRGIFVLIFLVLLLAAPPSAVGGLVSGTVTDAAGRAVTGATVSLYRSTALFQRATTGPDGRFAFPDLLPGNYAIECVAEGFQNLSRRVQVREQFQSVDLRLAVAGIHQRISVIASELPELPGEIGKSVSLVGREELRGQDARTLSEALLGIRGLQMQQLGGPGTTVSYRFRGLRPEDTAVLIDGFRFRDPADNRDSARPILSDLLVGDAERVEVLRGAGSSLYGTHAIGGTINVIPRQPSRPHSGAVSFGGGSLGLYEGAAEYGGLAADSRLSYFLQAGHRNYTGGIDGNDAYRNTSGSGMVWYRLPAQAQVSVRFAMTDSFSELNESPSPLTTLPALPSGVFLRDAIAYPESGATFHTQFDDPDYHGRNRFYYGSAKIDQQVNSRWEYAAGFQSLRTRRRYADGPAVSDLAQTLGHSEGPGVSRQSYEGSTDQIYWRNSIQVSRINSTHAGLDFDRETLDQTAFGLTTKAEQKSLGLVIQNVTRLLDGRLHLQLSAQGKWHDLDRPSFSDETHNPYSSLDGVETPDTYDGDVSVAYLLARTGTKLRAHAGNGHRSPSLYERFGGGGTGAFRSYYGNPQLRPERSVFLDGGFDQYLFRDTLQVSATYFYTRLQTISDFAVTPNDPFGRSFGYVNRAGGMARGVEIHVVSRPAAFLEINGSYTLSKSNQPDVTAAGTTRVLGLSNHQFTLGAAVHPARRVRLQFLATGASDYDFPVFGLTFSIPSSTYRFPGYARLDVAGIYTAYRRERTRVEWVTRVDNLLNREYYQGGFVVPKATARSGVRVEF
jgi:outer membrane receptor protein involved in Fe transport